MGLNLNEIKAQQSAQSASGQGFTPSTKADRSTATGTEAEQSQLATTTYDSAKERIQSGSLATRSLVDQTISAAQALAKTQADAIEHFPQLVDQLTVMYLQERGLADMGKPSAAPFSFDVQIPEMDAFNTLLSQSGAAARQMSASRTVQQLPEGS